MSKLIKASLLYDHKSILGCASSSAYLKDGQNGAIARENLITVSKKIHEYMPPNATLLSLGMTIDNTGGWGNLIKSLRIAGEGEHEKIGTSGQGGGKISVSGSESYITIDGYEGNSSYTVTELNQSKLENRNLHAELVGVHNKKYHERIDKDGYDSLLDVNNGFTRTDSLKTWRTMDDQELSDTIRNHILAQRSDLNAMYHCDTYVVPTELKNRCDATDYKAESELSITDKIKRSLNVKIIGSFRLTGAGAGGSDVALALNTNPNAVLVRIPKKFTLSPTHKLGHRFYFESMFRTGGVDILETSAGSILDKL